MHTLCIRPYTAQDYEAISRIHDEARKVELSFAALEEAYLPFCTAAQREGFFDYPHIDVAVVDGKVAAFSAYTSEELAWLYVAPESMRQGIGSALVRRALQQEPDIAAIEVLFGNEPARKLYESCGFRVHEIVHGVMPGNESFAVKVYYMTKA